MSTYTQNYNRVDELVHAYHYLLKNNISEDTAGREIIDSFLDSMGESDSKTQLVGYGIDYVNPYAKRKELSISFDRTLFSTEDEALKEINRALSVAKPGTMLNRESYSPVPLYRLIKD